MVILDCSESTGKCNHEKAKKAMKNMLDIASEIGYDNRYAVVTLATGATTDFNFVANLDAGFKIKNLPFIPIDQHSGCIERSEKDFEGPNSGVCKFICTESFYS